VLAPDRRLPFVFVDDLEVPVLSADDRHHLERVLRLRSGDALTAGDGAGRFRPTRLADPLVIDGDIVALAAPSPAITVAFALTKGDKPELVVQKLVEIGVDRIVPFVAERTVVRWDDTKVTRNVQRWRAIAREAAAQAHRPHLAEVADVTSFGELAARPGAALAHPEGTEAADWGDAFPATVLVGPEGGWSPEEELAVPSWVRVGPHILRAETAALVVATLAVSKR